MKERRYETMEKLGEGGSGQTYLVWDRRIGVKRVMKRISFQKAGQREMAAREIEALKRVRREGIPALFDVFAEEDCLCLVTEYMPGVPLSDKIRREGPMNEREALECGIQICELVITLHRMQPGLIHGDLKPSNLIWNRGRTALLDFGTACLKNGGGKETEGLCFTPGYGPPEQREGAPASESGDIYSLGATLFYLVTGTPPSPERGIYPVREQNPGLSGKLEKALLKCCAERPEERYRSMEEVKAALEKLLRNCKKGGNIVKWIVPDGWSGYDKEARGGRDFVTLKNVLLAEGRWERWMLLIFPILLALLLGGFSKEAELLPVNMRTKDGEKFLVRFDGSYTAEENPIFEIPLSCFQKGRDYAVTITMVDGKEKKRYARTFVICTD